MLQIKAKTKKLGNGIGVLLPKRLVERENIKPNQEVTLIINNKPITKGKDIWGTFKFKESTEKLMRETDKEFGLDF